MLFGILSQQIVTQFIIRSGVQNRGVALGSKLFKIDGRDLRAYGEFRR